VDQKSYTEEKSLRTILLGVCFVAYFEALTIEQADTIGQGKTSKTLGLTYLKQTVNQTRGEVYIKSRKRLIRHTRRTESRTRNVYSSSLI